MERFNKTIVLILMLVGIFLLTGCDKFKFSTFNDSEDNSVANVTVIPDDEQSGTDASQKDSSQKKSDNTSETTATAAAPTTKPLADIELQIYTVNEVPELEPVTVLVPEASDITPELIVDKVVESLADQSIMIECDSITAQGDSVIVSFIKDKAPYTNMGSEYEENILNAFAQSLIDNITSVKKVIFRIEGKAYSSGAFEYGIDEPYMSE